MISYLLECIAFQLAFLMVYEFILKKETFFQWNRVYLLLTLSFSFILPYIQIDSFGNLAQATPEIANFRIERLQEISLVAGDEAPGFNTEFIITAIFLLGFMVTALLFILKLRQLSKLRKQGTIYRQPEYDQVILAGSDEAFSFFKTVYLGEKLLARDYESILEHELVHVRQNHSVDLLFLEVIKVLCWFNPMVYLYQNRLRELHEFIADSEVKGTDRSIQYQSLLSEVFRTHKISFINQFYKSSLIKKRIVMLQKSRSKSIIKLKYLALLPLLILMLMYSSCQDETTEATDNPAATEETTNYIGIHTGDEVKSVPFSKVDKVPVFPGCEEAMDKKACFNEKMIQHIMKNFNYPDEALEKGMQGRVNVMFTLKSDGTIGEIKFRGPDKSLTDEAVRIIERLPKFEPGEYKGFAVDVAYEIPITFKLE